MAGTNPKAGSASKPGCANAVDSGGNLSLSGPYRPQDGAVVPLKGMVRVKGSAPGMDPRDPMNNSTNSETMGDTAAHG